ncbi:MAG TPA: hypothetical protein VH231_13365 [Solirubrobacteraceae bacterium]|nr:hypothetical protein [Solirubrobacteraceae bacterium]
MDGKVALRGFSRSTTGALRLLVAAALAVALLLAGGAVAQAKLALLKPTPDSLATFSGNGGYSADGLGQSEPGGTVQAEVPGGSTVVQAYLYGTYSGTGTIDNTNGVIDFDGTMVQLTQLPDVAPGCCGLNAGRADVTSQVAAKVGGGGGITDFAINNDPAGLEGVGLVVIYSNPNSPEKTIAVLDGGAEQTGDTVTFLFGSPLDLTAPGFGAIMSLGSGFSFQGVDGHACGGGQFSTVDVNAQRLTSCAGNYDDGFGANGGLITVGGVGDSTDNPADPNAESGGEDDELYNLVPLLHQGDQQLKIDTSNPSSDDNLFLAVVDITARARATTIDCSDPANASKIDCQAPPPPPAPAPASGGSGSSGSSTSSSGTSTQSTATTAPPPTAVPAACTDTRRFSFKLHHAPGQRVVRVDITANGKRLKTVKGRNLTTVTIDALPQETFTVKITSVQKSGSKLVSTRTYTGCEKGKPTTRAQHHRRGSKGK